ncbi:DUF1501 domain-containing protein [Lysobacter firmicutimachus]|uniref:DUF1501 domain-containing protein n=1 Tax=Lysobacter firmicutimachus TaxID=1792846 RepID=A0AAU8MX79_9GAMM
MDRRTFLGQSLLAAAGGAAAYAVPSGLSRLGAAVHRYGPGRFDDYKALVMVFLNGGNDGFNTVVPLEGAHYERYAAARATLALPASALLPLQPWPGGGASDGARYGLQSALSDDDALGTTGLQRLFGNGAAAVLGNVGTLIRPTDKDAYLGNRVPLPPQLFSHFDQAQYWQISRNDDSRRLGWGGRIADLMTPLDSGAAVPMLISINAAATWARAAELDQYVLHQTGPMPMNPTDAEVRQAMQELVAPDLQAHAMERSYAGSYRRARDVGQSVAEALASVAPPSTPFPATGLGGALRMVAHAIAARNALGHRRQIYSVSLGGFDTHDDQLLEHPLLLSTLSQAMTAFYDATVELGIDRGVTAFTASDFGRTLSSNGDGSDHGWGSHHFVVGGAVRGGRYYGRMPDLSVDGPDDGGQGRIIPTTSVDQYAATLARWFGVEEGDLDAILPNLRNFPTRDLGFLG